MVKTILSVPGMHCDNCRDTIQQALGNVPGVHVTHFDMRQHRISVAADHPVPPDVYVRALEEAGYESHVEPPDPVGTSTETGDPRELYGGEPPSAYAVALPGAPPPMPPLDPEASPQQLYGGADLPELAELTPPPAAEVADEARPTQLYGGEDDLAMPDSSPALRHGGGPPATDLQDLAEEEGLPWSRRSG